MKKIKGLMMTVIMCFIGSFVFAQWTYKTINSEFDGTFKKAYTKTDNNGYLAMEVGDSINKPFMGLVGSFFCDEYTTIDFILIVNGVNKNYEFRVFKSNDSRMYYFDESIWTDEFIKDFKSASSCSIRVNQSYCTNDYYKFIFSGSASAYNFITK
jgi:hypothetical protein